MLAPSLYADNAFRVLALSTRADEREIRRRAQALRLQGELDQDSEVVTRVRNALARLEDPSARLEEELFWFALTPDPVPQDLDTADGDRVTKLLTELEQMSAKGSDEAAHDLALLRHMAAIDTFDKDQPQWRPALESWEGLWADDRFWMRMKLRASELGDARATDEAVERLRKRLPERILDATAAEVMRLLETKGSDPEAREAIAAIRTSSFPVPLVTKARAQATSQLIGRLNDLVGDARKTVAVAENFTVNPTLGGQLARLGVEARRLKRLDSSPQVEAAVDGVADFLRNLGIRLYNETDDFGPPIRLLEEAYELATSAVTKTQSVQALLILRARHAVHEARQFADLGKWDDAIATLTKARKLAATPDEMQSIESFLAACMFWKAFDRAKQFADASKWDAAIAALLEARTLALDDEARQSVNEFLQVCRFRSTSDRAVAFAEEGQWAKAAMFATEAATLTDDGKQRTQLVALAARWRDAAAQGAPTPRQAAAAAAQAAEAAARSRRNGWIGAAVVGGIILLIIIWLAASSNQNGAASGTNSTTNDSNVTASCQSTKQALAAQMDSLKAEMAQLQSQMNALQAQMTSYGGPNHVPNSLVNAYNADVAAYNADVNRYEADRAAYNADVPQYNAMSC